MLGIQYALLGDLDTTKKAFLSKSLDNAHVEHIKEKFGSYRDQLNRMKSQLRGPSIHIPDASRWKVVRGNSGCLGPPENINIEQNNSLLAINATHPTFATEIQNSYNQVPRLDRSMTDICSDELYAPDFDFEAPPPSSCSQAASSPTNDMFARTLEAANGQHLQRSIVNIVPAKPSHPGARTGSYTCTYHGCTQRFDTPALLLRHKRAGHRKPSGVNGFPVAGDSFDNQGGSYKCELSITPGTGRPCNTIFSRPYDLSRHEAVFHKGQSQKVRCHICPEGTTFTRADGLTRHFRLWHPELEIPGNHRKGGVMI